MSRRVYIETYGCQMNVADSELMIGSLAQQGYEKVNDAEDADVIVLNTCAIREKAEERIFGRLGWLKSLKDRKPNVVLGVAGCMAAHLQDTIVERAPYVDLIVGPDAYRRLPQLINRCLEEETDPLIDVRLDRDEVYEGIEPVRQPGISGWITIMRGCDKFCTFCVVPYVRGRERSVPPDDVVRQARQMAEQGFREITLLGQTVSSYHVDGCTFAQLLRRLHDVPGISRIRYTSPYPNDFDDELLATLADLPKVARHIHLPVQSGSTRVLKDMNRGYTVSEYRSLIERVQTKLPEFSLTTDFIVGYPGETEDDFQQTLDLANDVKFDNAFMFKYSERSLTRAARTRPDDIAEEVKSERLQRLIAAQERQSLFRHSGMIGKTAELLIEGANSRRPSEQRGRSSCFKMTMVEGEYPVGSMLPVRVVAATTHTLFAQPLSAQPLLAQPLPAQPVA